ncbi:kelch-like ECH-associated protein 1 [Hydra vulgaris]|uniref:Kelch-like ECH-associated protein 1 n=1 Tax=Hydra vulgaris TaxID=6087 RepID=A0ABM4CJ57_HYDVU
MLGMRINSEQANSQVIKMERDDNTKKVIDKFHIDHILKQMYNDIFKGGNFADIILSFHNKEIRVHRIILAASSEVFSTMLQTNMKEKIDGKVDMELSGLLPRFADDFIKYLYTGEIELTVENVESLFSCANFFIINGLRDACSSFLKDILSPMNCLSVSTIANRYCCFDLEQKALKMLHDNFSLVANGTEFLNLSLEDLIEILSSDEIQVSSEDVVFSALMKWIYFDSSVRLLHFEDLFKCIRFPYLSQKFILTTKFQNSYYEKYLSRAISFNKTASPRKCLDTATIIMTTGGYDGNNCLLASFAFNTITKKWGSLAPMKVARHDHGTVLIWNKVFVIGGLNSHRGPISNVECFNPSQNQWSEVCEMNSKRKSAGVCVYNDKIFVSGGLDGSYNALDTVEFYDHELNTWNMFMPMNEARYCHGLVGNETCLFAVGGWKSASLERYYNSKWCLLSPMSIPRAGATYLIFNNKIYVFGGYSERYCVSSFEIYDITLDNWVIQSSSQISRWRAGSTLVNNKLFIIGGRDCSWKYLDIVESYDLERDEWSIDLPFPFQVMGLECSTLNLPKHFIRFSK